MTATPNIVLILADDMGYGDPRCLNPESLIPTPSLDRIASEGVRFCDAHSNSAVCTPTRYGILTGRYCWRGRLKNGVLFGYSPPLIEEDRLTLPSLLRQQGYRTACIGKWHLGLGWDLPENDTQPNSDPDLDFSAPLPSGPHTAGFDDSFIIAASLDMPPYCYIENGRVLETPDRRIPSSVRPAFWRGGWSSPSFAHEECLHTFTTRAEEWIDDRGKTRDRPFFLYMPLPSPHTPHCPRAPFRNASGAGPYGDLVAETDWSVGRVLDALSRNGFADNTLVIFTSDNGSDARGIPGGCAHRTNHTFRGMKSDAWDGGHRIPLLARWPGVIPPGGRCDRLACLTDFMATAAAITGARLPLDSAEDSFNLLPLLRDPSSAPVRNDIIHHSITGQFAIRERKWKLVACRGSGGWSLPEKDVAADAPPMQLYDMESDPSEQTNLFRSMPSEASRLTERLAACRSSPRTAPRPA